MIDRVVIVGSSIGGTRTAGGLRAAGYQGAITLVDPDRAPHDRPPLSKQVLAGTWTPEQASLGDPASQFGAEVHTASAVGLDRSARRVLLDTGEELPYDRLVIATGASAKPFPGPCPQGVHTLRTLDDCLRLQADLAAGNQLAVVGGGFIGAEIASTARARGLAVTMIDPLPTPMYQAVGEDIGRLLAQLHADNGVDIRCGIGVQAIEGDPRARCVILTDGTPIAADVVAIGVGVTPNTAWLDDSELHLADGLVSDEYCAADPEGSIYAVGDVARWHDRSLDRDVRVEHWTNAIEQANTVAHNIANPDHRRPHTARPYFWSDQHGSKLQMIGHPSPKHDVALVNGPRTRQRAAVYVDGETVRAALTLNWPRALASARKAMDRGGRVTETMTALEELA